MMLVMRGGAMNGDFSQKCTDARKDLRFELRRTVLYVEAQILSPDAADGRFSSSTIFLRELHLLSF